MQVYQARRHTKRPTLIIALLVVGLLIAGWVFFGKSAGGALQSAGSAAIVAPIAPLRLVSAMGESEKMETNTRVADNLSLTDAEIETAVAKKLVEMKLPAESVKLDVKDREAHLSGRVDDPLLRDAIEITVRSVPGVRTVKNQLEVLNAAKKEAP